MTLLEKFDFGTGVLFLLVLVSSQQTQVSLPFVMFMELLDFKTFIVFS